MGLGRSPAIGAQQAMVEMSVAAIALDAASRSPIVLLRDPSGRRQVPIWIDQAQAQNILAGVNRVRPPRPLSHDLMVSLMEAGGLSLERVIIHAIEDNTFRAVLKVLDGAGNPHEVDARPSDAIAIALRFGAPIYVDDKIFDKSQMVDGDYEVLNKSEDGKKWAEYLENLNPEDFGKYKV